MAHAWSGKARGSLPRKQSLLPGKEDSNLRAQEVLEAQAVVYPVGTWVPALLQSKSSMTAAILSFFQERDGMLVTLVLKIFSDGLFLPCTIKGNARPSTACLVACL